MKCLDHQLAVSCLVDGELAAEEITRTLDHLLQCPGCRDFYEGARALDTRLASVAVVERRPRPHWAWSAVAAAVIGMIGLGLVGDRAPAGLATTSAERVIDATGRRDMSDARFVDLTVELLQADPRYHLEMMDVLRQAHAHEDLDEGSWSSRLARSDVRHGHEFEDEPETLVH